MQADGTGNRRSPDELWAGLVAEMTTMPDVVANLLREHQPDEQGLCRRQRMRHGGPRSADDTLAVLAARARRRGCRRTAFALDDSDAAVTRKQSPPRSGGPAYSDRSASDRSSLRTLSTFHRA